MYREALNAMPSTDETREAILIMHIIILDYNFLRSPKKYALA